MRIQTLSLSLVLASLPCVAAATCESLAAAKLPNATITSASVVAPGAFEVPVAPDAKGGKGGKGKGPNPYANLPSFCRVTATLAPSKDSDIKVEVWLPSTGWNGKYEAVGNGGWAGTISYTAMATALERGYATSSTDTGHVGGRGTFALDHPEKLIDYAYRSEHEMVLKSKALIQNFYGSPARFSYWVGCSTGGKQGLTEAQRYPNDFDGIIAGAPANYMIHLHAWSLWVYQAMNKTPDSFLETAQLQTLHQAAIKACDALDGVSDGVIENPRKCKFDPATIQCAAGVTTGCLNPSQVAAAKMIYSAATNPRNKAEVFPPLEPGSELQWGTLGGKRPADVAADTFRFVVFKNPDWDALTLNFDADVTKADKLDDGLNNAINPDLSKFFDHKGRLLMYHGWNDQLIAPGNSINYYNSVAGKLGGVSKIDQNMRLFMTPGMQHCNGGEGPNTFDALTLMEQWVEQSKAPEKMIASHSTAGQVDRTRPLCAYPQTAVYNGSGSTNEAANFSCKLQ
ncbi:MAG: tannase/feruloyl esterase family alpha/beta hydrolase [Acidobacteriota bacterium]